MSLLDRVRYFMSVLILHLPSCGNCELLTGHYSAGGPSYIRFDDLSGAALDASIATSNRMSGQDHSDAIWSFICISSMPLPDSAYNGLLSPLPTPTPMLTTPDHEMQSPTRGCATPGGLSFDCGQLLTVVETPRGLARSLIP